MLRGLSGLEWRTRRIIMASNTDTKTTTEANATSNAPASEPSEAAEEPGLNGDGATTQPEPTTSPPPPAKGGGKGKGKLKAGAKKGKGKGKGADGPSCGNCGEPASQKCTGCGMVHYCTKNIVIKNGKKVNLCQQVMSMRLPAGTDLPSNHKPHPLPSSSLLLTGALEVWRPQERVQGLRARRHCPRAAGAAV